MLTLCKNRIINLLKYTRNNNITTAIRRCSFTFHELANMRKENLSDIYDNEIAYGIRDENTIKISQERIHIKQYVQLLFIDKI